MARPERSHLEEHYADLSGRSFFPGLIDYMVSHRRNNLYLVIVDGHGYTVGNISYVVIGEAVPNTKH